MTAGEPFRVLLVCTANMYRSVVGEFVLAKLASGCGLPWQIGSAGTHARPGAGLRPEVVEVLERRGIAPAPWQSRALTRELVADADLVLTAAREHRGTVVTLLPAALRRTFTVRQLAGLLEVADPGGAHRDGAFMIEAALAARGLRAAGEGDDIADPVGTGPAGLEARAAELEAALRVVVGYARKGGDADVLPSG